MADDVPNSACRGGLDCRFGAGHGEERTRSMPPMYVTLEVSKLSGWLNATAFCREPNGGYTRCGASCDPGGGGRAAGDGGASSVQGRARLQIGGRAREGAHPEHVAHVCDAGGVEAQRLVERPRAEEHEAHLFDAGRVEAQRLVERPRVLPRVERRAYRNGARRGARREAGGRRATAVQAGRRGEGSTAGSGQSTGRSARGTCSSCS